MILKRRVALNGVWLDQADSRIVISGIEPGDGKENIQAVDAASGYGQRITSRRRSTLDLVVKFMMLERGKSVTGLQNRAEILEKVNEWASAGGVLTLNYKPGRRLHVVLAQAPGEGSLWDYTKEFQITFRAYTIPYWEDSTESTRVIGDDIYTSEDEITVGGSAETQAGFELVNTGSAAISEATVDIGGKTMYFTGLNLAVGDTLAVDHTDGLVRIRTNVSGSWVNAMGTRTAASADDFRVQPGDRDCSYTADQDCTVTVKWRNRYL